MSVRPHCVRLLYSFLSVRPRGCNYNCKYLLLFFFFEVFNRYEKSPPRIHFIMETKISRVLFHVESWSYGNFFPENPTLGKRTQNRGFFFHFIFDYHGSDRKYATNHSRARSVTFRFWAEGGFTLFVCYCQYVYHQKTLSNPNTFILCLFQICTCRYYKENNFRKRLTLEMAKTRFRQTRGLLFFFFLKFMLIPGQTWRHFKNTTLYRVFIIWNLSLHTVTNYIPICTLPFRHSRQNCNSPILRKIHCFYFGSFSD